MPLLNRTVGGGVAERIAVEVKRVDNAHAGGLGRVHAGRIRVEGGGDGAVGAAAGERGARVVCPWCGEMGVWRWGSRSGRLIVVFI